MRFCGTGRGGMKRDNLCNGRVLVLDVFQHISQTITWSLFIVRRMHSGSRVIRGGARARQSRAKQNKFEATRSRRSEEGGKARGSGRRQSSPTKTRQQRNEVRRRRRSTTKRAKRKTRKQEARRSGKRSKQSEKRQSQAVEKEGG